MALIGSEGEKLGEKTDAESDSMDSGECRGCGAPIYWVTMKSGKKHPVDRGRQVRVVFVGGQWEAVGAYTSHFSSCPKRDEFRRRVPNRGTSVKQ